MLVMSIKLTQMVDDENLSWDESLINSKEKFLVSLSTSTINKILECRSVLISEKRDEFDFLKNEIFNFKKILNSGCGFFIIDGNNFKDFSKKELEHIFSIISQFLGKLYVQNIKNEKFVLIQDEGKSMKTGGRYHQTKEGGSYHTDSPQWPDVPDSVGLLCINPAKEGGINKFLSAYSIHNEINKKDPFLLELLYSKFYFDKRGEFKEGESPTVFEPIFSYTNNELHFRYLRNYIDDGYKTQNKILSNDQINSLNIIDEVTQNKKLSLDYEMKSGHFALAQPTIRPLFEDFEDQNLKRKLVRVWIKN